MRKYPYETYVDKDDNWTVFLGDRVLTLKDNKLKSHKGEVDVTDLERCTPLAIIHRLFGSGTWFDLSRVALPEGDYYTTMFNTLYLMTRDKPFVVGEESDRGNTLFGSFVHDFFTYYSSLMMMTDSYKANKSEVVGVIEMLLNKK